MKPTSRRSMLALLGLGAGGSVIGAEAVEAKQVFTAETQHNRFDVAYSAYVQAFAAAMPEQYDLTMNSVIMTVARAHAIASATVAALKQ